MKRSILIGLPAALFVFALWTMVLAETANPTHTPPPNCSDISNPPTATGITWPYNAWDSNVAGGTILQPAGTFDWILGPKNPIDHDCCGQDDWSLSFTWSVEDQIAPDGWFADAWVQPGYGGIIAKSVTAGDAKMRSNTWGYAKLKMRVDDNSVTSQCIINEEASTTLQTYVKFIQIIAPPDKILDYDSNETITFQVKPDAGWVDEYFPYWLGYKYRFSLNGNPILWKDVPFFTIAELRAAVPNYTTGEIMMEAAGDKDPSLFQTHWIVVQDSMNLRLGAGLKGVVYSQGNHPIFQDNGVQYSVPHWRDANKDGDADDVFPNERKIPVAYTKNTIPRLSALFEVNPSDNITSIRVRGKRNGQLYVPETDVSNINGVFLLPATEALIAFEDKIQFINTHNIDWEILFSDYPIWYHAGTSKNRVYVTNGNPLNPLFIFPLAESIYDISCRNANGLGNDPDDPEYKIKIFESIWNDFKNPIPGVFRKDKDGFNNVDGEEFKYWASTNPTQDIIELLTSNENDGACKAWADLLICAYLIQGLDTSDLLRIAVSPSAESNPPLGGTTRDILIKNWKFVEPGTGPYDPYKYKSKLPTEFTHDPAGGVPGQGVYNTAHKHFNIHYLVKFNEKYYDPSYGSGPFNDEIHWENESIDGFVRGFEGYPVPQTSFGKKNKAGKEVDFTEMQIQNQN